MEGDQAAVEAAKLNLQYTRIEAPASGLRAIAEGPR